jgi:hypothetical protein
MISGKHRPQESQRPPVEWPIRNFGCRSKRHARQGFNAEIATACIARGSYGNNRGRDWRWNAAGLTHPGHTEALGFSCRDAQGRGGEQMKLGWFGKFVKYTSIPKFTWGNHGTSW